MIRPHADRGIVMGLVAIGFLVVGFGLGMVGMAYSQVTDVPLEKRLTICEADVEQGRQLLASVSRTLATVRVELATITAERDAPKKK